MIIEALMVVALAYYRTWEVGVILLVLISFRRAPWFANAIADMLDLDQTSGMTLWIARVGLPAWDDARSVMSRSEGAPEERIAPELVHVPIQGTALVSANPVTDRDIITNEWIVKLADARDEKGGDLFSANDIFKAVGGHRAAVLARVKEIRSGVPPAQFKQGDGTTAPADYPVTKTT